MKKLIILILSAAVLYGCSNQPKKASQMHIQIKQTKDPIITIKCNGDVKKINLKVSTYQKKAWKVNNYQFPMTDHQCTLTLKIDKGVFVYRSDVLYRSRKFIPMNHAFTSFMKDQSARTTSWQHVAGILSHSNSKIRLSEGRHWHPDDRQAQYVLFSVKTAD